MRKLFYLCIFLGGYIWVINSGNEQFFLERGKALYRIVAQWFEDAELDFQLDKKKSSSKKSQRQRRWD